MNAILNSRYSVMEENKIDIHFNIETDKCHFVNPVDLCSLLTNSLDNEIEACLRIKLETDRHISLKIRYDKNYLSLLCVNSKINRIQESRGGFISDRTGKGHGYGIANIKDIAHKYHGEARIEHNENEFSRFIFIPGSE